MSLDLDILKVLVTNKKHALDFASEGNPDWFSPDTWNFAKLTVGYIKTYKELPTLRVLIEKLTKGNNDKTIEYIKNTWSQLETVNYNDREYKHDLGKLKKRFAEKQLISLKENISKLEPGNVDITKTVTNLQQTITNIKNINQSKAFDRKTLKEAVPIFRDEYNAKQDNPNFEQGIPTGYSYLDNVTDGLRPGELLLIGGESNAGKSMLLMNMAVQIWMQNNNIDMTENFNPGNNILYFSLEMPYKPCMNRVLARMSGCQSKLIRNAKLNNDDALKLKKALKFITKYPNQFEIVDYPRGATMENLELIYEDAKVNYDPKIIVIDYLGLMGYDGPEMDDWLKLGKIAERVHEFARVHNCIVLSAVQLNRAKPSKDMEEKIGLHRVGRSALIMQNANIAIQIESRANEKQYPDMYYHLIKNRDGELGKGKLLKNLSCGTLLDDKIEEDDTTFEMRDPDDISDKMALLEDDDEDEES